ASWLPTSPFPPEDPPQWMASLRREILQIRVPQRKGRFGLRGVKRKISGYPIRRSRGPTKRREPAIRMRSTVK
ncbi:MAG TPA: hypothetical protein VIS96_16100, partial [Terrimicrobiaceae bacterium]